MNERHELGFEYYDNVYMFAKKYQDGYKKSPYLKIWEYIMTEALSKNDTILDLGCGTGQFAQMCKAYKKNYILGIDFSPQAIKMAQERCPDLKFIEGNLMNQECYNACMYNTAVCLEVLEHVTRDQYILQSLTKGTKVIFGVPNFDSAGHVRMFKSKREIRERYGHLVSCTNIKIFKLGNQGNKIYIVTGRRK
jgi:trans-aconitate methyltransferase